MHFYENRSAMYRQLLRQAVRKSVSQSDTQSAGPPGRQAVSHNREVLKALIVTVDINSSFLKIILLIFRNS